MLPTQGKKKKKTVKNCALREQCALEETVKSIRSLYYISVLKGVCADPDIAKSCKSVLSEECLHR